MRFDFVRCYPPFFPAAFRAAYNPQRRHVRREDAAQVAASLRILRPESAGFKQNPVGVAVAGEPAPPSTRASARYPPYPLATRRLYAPSAWLLSAAVLRARTLPLLTSTV